MRSTWRISFQPPENYGHTKPQKVYDIFSIHYYNKVPSDRLDSSFDTNDEFDMVSILWGRKIIGNVEGYVRPKIDIPRYVRMYMNGTLNLDPIVTRVYRGLENAKKALDAIKERKISGKQVIIP